MRIVYMGTPDFAVFPLEEMIKAGHEVVAVVTQPDKPKGRGKAMQFTPVKECAVKYDIPVYQPLKVKDEKFIEILEGLKPEIIVVAAFGQILPEAILELPRYGCVNIHASLLPKYRGAAPIQRAIIDGEKETGVTIMYMEKGLDTGDMIAKSIVPIADDETGGSLHDKLAVAGAKLIVETLPKIEADDTEAVKQNDEESSYAKMLSKDMGILDFSKSAVELDRLIRGLNPWPSAFTKLEGKTLKLFEVIVIDDDFSEKPGTIVNVTKKDFTIVCGNGGLLVKSLQLEGKKRMDTDAFLRGFALTEGTLLGE
ncbi:MAG: methionyl-tRNA formyltransferase [Lachnospiraceae bacterium]|nr:methionyl-tRNA formyltransferase [Lachnospiraceae bacterium]